VEAARRRRPHQRRRLWDRPHKQIGNAQNYAELHPVTGFKVLTDCGA
jgi:hypothetical protein